MTDIDNSDEQLLTELDLGPERPRVLGRPRAELYMSYERDLTEADIAALALPRGSAPPALKRIHSSHHSVARCLAAGMKPGQVALVTGYSASRISILQNDPAFQALVQDYRTEAKSVFGDLAERMTNISLDAIELLQERLQDDPAQFSIPMLLDVVKAMADRTGHGPGQDVNVRIGPGDFIDRPPRETFEQWEQRRSQELNLTPAPPLKKLN